MPNSIHCSQLFSVCRGAHLMRPWNRFAAAYALRIGTSVRVALLLLCVSPARALDVAADTTKRFEEVMIVGLKEHEVPGSGIYVDKKTIEQVNQPDVNKVLRLVAGVNVRDEEGFGLRPNIGLRGTPVNRSAKITLMEDGVLIAPAPYADPDAYFFPSFSRMEGLEILKGSSQIEYGPYTIGGALNLISTSFPDMFSGFAELSYGSFGNNKERLWIGDSRSNVDYVFEAHRLASDGFKILDNGDATGFDRRDVMGKVRWHSSAGSSIDQALTLKFVQSSELANESYLGLSYDDYMQNPVRRYSATQKDLLDMNHTHFSLSHSINPSAGVNVRTTAYYTKTFREWGRVNSISGVSALSVLSEPQKYAKEDSVMKGVANGSVEFRSAARTYYSTGVQSAADYSFATGEIAHRLRIGVRYHTDESDRWNTSSTFQMSDNVMSLGSAGILGNIENQIRRATASAAFAQYRLIAGPLTFTPGVRFEHITLELLNYGTTDNARQGSSLLSAANTLTAILPGAGLNYEFSNSVSAFAGVHRGFSPPGMPSTTSGSAQAVAEKAWNYEVGVRSMLGGIRAVAVAFVSDYESILGSDNVSGGGQGTGDLFNAGAATVQGLELNMGYEFSDVHLSVGSFSVPINLSYTYTDARFDQTFKGGGGDWGSGVINQGDVIPFITPHQLSLQCGVSTGDVQLLCTGRYTGATATKPGRGSLIIPGEGTSYTSVNALAATMFVDATCNVGIAGGVVLSGSVTNVGNSSAIVANLPQGYRPSMPRALNLGVKWTFL